MATAPPTLINVIDPPPRLTGEQKQDLVAIVQWLNAFYVKGVIEGGLLQVKNLPGAMIPVMETQYPNLDSFAQLTGAVNDIAYFTGPHDFALTPLSPFARTLIDDVDAAAARATLGTGTVTAVNGTAPITSTGGNTPSIGIVDFIASGAAHARGSVPDPGAAAGATKFLREDATWSVPVGSGDVIGPAGATDGNVVLFNTATGKLIKDGGTLGSAAFTSSAAYQPADPDLTTWASVTPGTGVATALAVNVGSVGSVVLNGGALGTPSSGVLTNCTGTAAGLTAGTVTTNANLTGEATSVGNAATLTNSAVIGKVITGYASGAGVVAATDTILQAIQKLNGNDATNANLTGPITSVGNATAVASQTGTGSKFVMDTAPVISTAWLTGVTTFGIRGAHASTDRISVTGATTIFSLATTAASAGASGALVLVNGYLIVTPTISFLDLVMFVGGVAPSVIVSATVNRGVTPAVRTYSASGGSSLQLAMASGTYNVSCFSVEQPC